MVILIGIEIEIEIEVKWAEVSVVMYISIYTVSCKRRMQPLLDVFTKKNATSTRCVYYLFVLTAVVGSLT